jgi:hypothetical protein
MENFTFKRQRIDKISRTEMVSELKRVAEIYNFVEFTRRDFEKVAKTCKATVIINEFGTWLDALNSLNLELKPKEVIDRNIISKKELFEELERVWKISGHRPSKTQWDISKSKYSYSTYKNRFGGWANACLQFIEYKKGKTVIVEDAKPKNFDDSFIDEIDTRNQEVKRWIPSKLRVIVLKRDNYCCVLCGGSPAIKQGVNLHIDHIFPYSKGGKTVLENLRTLCAECNWGKGDDINI